MRRRQKWISRKREANESAMRLRICLPELQLSDMEKMVSDPYNLDHQKNEEER
jgi:hypothetical protein